MLKMHYFDKKWVISTPIVYRGDVKTQLLLWNLLKFGQNTYKKTFLKFRRVYKTQPFGEKRDKILKKVKNIYF